MAPAVKNFKRLITAPESRTEGAPSLPLPSDDDIRVEAIVAKLLEANPDADPLALKVQAEQILAQQRAETRARQDAEFAPTQRAQDEEELGLRAYRETADAVIGGLDDPAANWGNERKLGYQQDNGFFGNMTGAAGTTDAWRRSSDSEMPASYYDQFPMSEATDAAGVPATFTPTQVDNLTDENVYELIMSQRPTVMVDGKPTPAGPPVTPQEIAEMRRWLQYVNRTPGSEEQYRFNRAGWMAYQDMLNRQRTQDVRQDIAETGYGTDDQVLALMKGGLLPDGSSPSWLPDDMQAQLAGMSPEQRRDLAAGWMDARRDREASEQRRRSDPAIQNLEARRMARRTGRSVQEVLAIMNGQVPAGEGAEGFPGVPGDMGPPGRADLITGGRGGDALAGGGAVFPPKPGDMQAARDAAAAQAREDRFDRIRGAADSARYERRRRLHNPLLLEALTNEDRARDADQQARRAEVSRQAMLAGGQPTGGPLGTRARDAGLGMLPADWQNVVMTDRLTRGRVNGPTPLGVQAMQLEMAAPVVRSAMAGVLQNVNPAEAEARGLQLALEMAGLDPVARVRLSRDRGEPIGTGYSADHVNSRWIHWTYNMGPRPTDWRVANFTAEMVALGYDPAEVNAFVAAMTANAAPGAPPPPPAPTPRTAAGAR